MKELKKVWLIGLMLLAAGCQSTAEEPQKPDAKGGEQYGKDQIFNRNGEIEDFDRFEVFLSNIGQKQADAIRIVNYTVEGDPIYQDLTFTGKAVEYVYDATKDSYGAGEIFKMACTSIEKEEQADVTDYVLAGCDSNSYPLILSVRK